MIEFLLLVVGGILSSVIAGLILRKIDKNEKNRLV